MNPQIKELALQCGAWHQVYDRKLLNIDENFNYEKFAEAIIRECSAQCAIAGDLALAEQIKYYFGVKE